ncbi:X-ray repair cross-complementing protein 5 isoform X2 [Nilaparvata lugens]|nr:X-ray repair cross-complementing protein 5 isoform X2 [Nilaparvata lugens]
MASFDSIIDASDDEQEDQLFEHRGKESTIFLIDFRKSMHKCGFFKHCLLNIKKSIQKSIKEARKIIFGIILFGTGKRDATSYRQNIALLLPLALCSVERLKRINEMIISSDDIIKEYGQSDDASLAEALEASFHFFTNCNTKLGSKRIVLFTNDDNPDGKNKDKQHQTRKRAEDIAVSRIDLDIIPLGEKFDSNLFYQEIIHIVKKGHFYIEGPFSTSQDFSELINRQSYTNRSFGRIRFNLGNDTFIGCAIYKFTVSHLLKKVNLHRETNEPVRSVRQFLHPSTVKVLRPFEYVTSFTIANKVISFSDDEWNMFNNGFEPQITLLEFRSIDDVDLEFTFCNPLSFLFPDESVVEGSTTLFSALLNRCLERRIAALCIYNSRRGSKPRHVLLIPQHETENEDVYEKMPAGFHVFYLPFAGSIGEMPTSNIKTEESPENVDLMKKMIKKLKIQYSPSTMDNPKTSLEWAHIEAHAIDTEDLQDIKIDDQTIPDTETIDERLDFLIEDFNRTFETSCGTSSSKSSKRPAKSNTTRNYTKK